MIRRSAASARLYATTARHVAPRGGLSLGARLGPPDERLVFVVGSPRSGTTMLATAIATPLGFVDLGEVAPLKALVPELVLLPEQEAADRLRRVLERVRILSLVRGLRAVEQTPEVAYLVRPALLAYPQAVVVHIVRDGRDVVCSLLERGWLRAERVGRDDARLPYGAGARFWVEPERAQEFEQASDATRAAWAWRRYVEAARSHLGATLEIRYEELVADPAAAAEQIAAHIDADVPPLVQALAVAHGSSVGRWRRDLTAEQLEDVDREAGRLLVQLGYDQGGEPRGNHGFLGE